MRVCQHLGEQVGVLVGGQFGEEAQHACGHPDHKSVTLGDCLKCSDYFHQAKLPDPTRPKGKPAKSDAQKSMFVTRDGDPVAVGGLCAGASAFLVLGGPSALKMPLWLLGRRGVMTISVNNCPAVLPPPLRPNIWLHTDPSRKFCESIWRDPAVWKFIPVREWGKKDSGGHPAGIRTRQEDGSLDFTGAVAKEMPSIIGYRRNTEFRPEVWLHEPTINRGNAKQYAEGNKGHEPNGWPNTINTMFSAVRLPFVLGIRKLYLIGADFRMSDDQPYGFAQPKSAGGVRANNNAYESMNVMFEALLPYFREAGYQVINCTPESGLRVFPYLDFREAIDDVTKGFEQRLSAEGYYDDAPAKC